MTTRRTGLALLVAAGLAWTGGVQPASAQGKDVVVFAAASLQNAVDEIARQWHRETGKTAVISYAASNTLIKQIEQGARADIFFSADLDWMDYGQQKDLIKPDTRFNLLENRLVLIAPRDASVRVNIQPGFDLATLLKGSPLAMGNVDAVPAGKYGKAALEKLGVWDSVKDKIAPAESVRAALLLVSRGKAALGIVYQTDVAADLRVKIVGMFPREHASSDHLPDRADEAVDQSRRAGVPELSALDQAAVRAPGLYRAGPRSAVLSDRKAAAFKE